MPLMTFLMMMLQAPPDFSTTFDCRKASLAVEKEICASELLSRRDRALSALYKIAPKEQWVVVGQKRWMKTLRNSCPDPECIASAYEWRFSELAKEVDEQALPLYARPEEDGYLQVIDLGGGWHAFDTSAHWENQETVNATTLTGLFRQADGRAEWRPPEDGGNCALHFTRLSPTI